MVMNHILYPDFVLGCVGLEGKETAGIVSCHSTVFKYDFTIDNNHINTCTTQCTLCVGFTITDSSLVK